MEETRNVYAIRGEGMPVRTIIPYKNERSEVFEGWRRISETR